MSRRKLLDIKKEILRVLNAEGEISLRELDIKVNTSSRTIQSQIEELEYFQKVRVTKHKRSENNGRAYTTVKIS